MQRKEIKSIKYIVGYHTQENRPELLTAPIICKRKSAWLGKGYYYWVEDEFAHYWGIDMKSKNGYYDIYISDIKEENILNASFNEDEYYFFRESIDKARAYLLKKGENPNLQKVHRFLADKVWPDVGVKGIIYDDLPTNPKDKDRVYSDVLPLYYEKRIQIVIFNLNIMTNFVPYKIKEESQL